MICAKPNPARNPITPPRIAVMKISVSTRPEIAPFCAPMAFIRPISDERSMTLAVTRLQMPSAAPIRLRIVMSTIRSCVFSRIAPSESATCRTGDATESVMTSWI